MAPQTPRITRPSPRSARAALTHFLLAACCGGLLCSAVAASATIRENGISLNGERLNGISLNGENLNGQSLNGLVPKKTTLQQAPLLAASDDRFPFHSVSQRALGKHQRPACTGPLCSS